MRAEFETKKAKLDGYASLVENYENGFLRETKALDKDIMAIAEYSMRILEKLDGYSIAEVIFIQTSVQLTPRSLTVSDFFCCSMVSHRHKLYLVLFICSGISKFDHDQLKWQIKEFWKI